MIAAVEIKDSYAQGSSTDTVHGVRDDGGVDGREPIRAKSNHTAPLLAKGY